MPAEPDRESPPLWGLKFNRYLAGALALLMVIWLITVLEGRVHWIVFLMAPVFWAYFLGALLLIEWAVLRILKKGAPALPFVPAGWSGRRTTLIVMIVFVALVTVVREGALAPEFALNFNWYTADHRRSTTANTSGSSAHTGPPIRFARRFVNCRLYCRPDGALCRSFKQSLRCDNHRTTPAAGQPVVNVDVTMHAADEPFCYTPLIKSSVFQYTAMVRAWAGGPKGTKNASMNVTGSVDQQMYGFGSCYTFKRLVGKMAAIEVAGKIRWMLAKN
jgi:hypothetical protein